MTTEQLAEEIRRLLMSEHNSREISMVAEVDIIDEGEAVIDVQDSDGLWHTISITENGEANQ